MVAKDVMRPPDACVQSEASLRVAALALLESGQATAIIVDRDQRPVGVLSRGDILAAAMPDYFRALEDLSFLPASLEFPPPDGQDLDTTTVAAILERTAVLTVRPQDPLVEILRLLLGRKADLCAVIEEGRLVGVVREQDLLAILAQREGAAPPA